jgi:hypothetical protein
MLQEKIRADIVTFVCYLIKTRGIRIHIHFDYLRSGLKEIID